MARYDRMWVGGVVEQSPAFGVNYFLMKHNSKIQAFFYYLNNANGINGTYALLDTRAGTLFILSFQSAI